MVLSALEISDAGHVAAEATLFVGGQNPARIVVPGGEVVSCRLLDAAGGLVPFGDYAIAGGSRGSVSTVDGDRRHRELRLLWPVGLRRLEIRLTGAVTGEIALERPGQACVIRCRDC